MDTADIKLIKGIHKQLKDTEALLKAEEMRVLDLTMECQHLRKMLSVAVEGLTEYAFLNEKAIHELNELSLEMRH